MRKYILAQNFITELHHSADWARKQFPTYQSVMTLQSGHRLSILSSSAKTNKGKDFDIAILYLASHRSVKGINNCRYAGVCPATCIDKSGKMPFHEERRTRLTLALYLFPEEFITELLMELSFAAFKAKQQGKKCWVRLNGTSDIRWEHLIDIASFVADNDGIGGFYDYTKYPKALRSDVPSCYKLTYSFDEQEHAPTEAKKYMDAGSPVAIVLDRKDYKKAKEHFAFTDGDADDYRFRDTGIVVLKAKSLFKGAKYRGRTIIQSIDAALQLLA
jgi:hypothetical protein